MDQLTLIERFRENEELARKFHEVESNILSVLNFRDFFEHLLLDIGEIFAIPLVWFTLIDDVDLCRLIRHSATSKVLRERIKVVDRETFGGLLPDTGRPLLVNEGLHRYQRLLPAPGPQALGSLGLVPVTLDGEVVGSLNLADRSVSRYAPGLNTVLVERLALKVSLCLSNVTAHEKLQKVAHYDPLTDLLNRRAMESILQREFDRARRYSRPLSLVFIDLDDFKRINDSHGHDCVDLVLKHLAAGMIRQCRASDVVTRFAGDEFVLILPETGRDRAEGLMARILGALARHPLLVAGETIAVKASYGIASSEDASIGDAVGLLKAADQRLYASKAARKQEAPDV